MSDELDELTNDAEEQAETVETENVEKGEVVTEESPSSGEDDSAIVSVAVLRGERERRQAAEQELAELKAKQEVTARPDANEDPEGAITHLEAMLSQETWKIRSSLSRSLMASQHDDYAEREAEFMKLAEKTPQLVSDMFASEDPARFAYTTAKQHQEYEAIKDVDSYREKIRAEVRAEELAKLTEEGAVATKREESREAAAGLPNLESLPSDKGGYATPSDDDLSSICVGDNL